MPGWTEDDGARIAALELVLQPGWKTYWRSPGNSGIPPHFDWSGSVNIGDVDYLWPAPEVINSGGERTLGYHDRLILPMRIAPLQDDQPVQLTAQIAFGLCKNICVPAEISVQAPAPQDQPDPAIMAALDRVPRANDGQLDCFVSEIADGMRLTMAIPETGGPAAMELDSSPEIWVSPVEIAEGAATAEFVPPSGQPFDLDQSDLVLTLLGAEGAVEYRGCRLVDGPIN